MTQSQPNNAFANLLARHQDEFLAIEGVVGLGLGERPDGTAVLAIYVIQDSSELRRRIPAVVEGIPTEVRESGEFLAQTLHREAEP